MDGRLGVAGVGRSMKGMPMTHPHETALAGKHQKLATRIEEEEHRPKPDTDLINRLKREKLQLKDEMTGH